MFFALSNNIKQNQFHRYLKMHGPIFQNQVFCFITPKM